MNEVFMLLLLKLASVLHNYYLQTKLIPRTPMSLIPMDEGEKGENPLMRYVM